MPSKELFASVIEAIIKNPPKVTRFKDMETLEHSEAIDHAPTAEAAISTILAALQEPTQGMVRSVKHDLAWYHAKETWISMLNASPLGEKSE